MRSGFLTLTFGLAAAAATVVPPVPPAVAQTGAQPLVGTFHIAAGSCRAGAASGSTFRMVLPSGDANGPFVSNNDSACSDHSFTLLAPGSDGGLRTGAHQPEPNPAFDGNGNSLASRITKPARFQGVAFSTSTNPRDPQTGVSVGAPSVAAQNGKLTGDLRAFAASWNRQEFNQGAPKPDGSAPGNTTALTGTYDAGTGAFTLNWGSQIQGGPFNNFTGLWHLEGSFTPASSGASTGGSSTTPDSTAAAPSRSNTAGGTSGVAAGSTPPSTTEAGAGASVAASPSTTTTEQPSAASSGRRDLAAARSDNTDKTSDDGGGPVAVAAIVAVLALGAAGGWLVRTRLRRGRGGAA